MKVASSGDSEAWEDGEVIFFSSAGETRRKSIDPDDYDIWGAPFTVNGKTYVQITEDEVIYDEDLKAVFPDVLSDFVCTLEAKGFKVETTGEWPDAKSRVNIEYLTRIMDNLLSNILKYADSGVPVRLLFFCRDRQFSVELYNRIVKRHRTGDSSHIGMENVRSLMERMGGSYEHEEADGIFCSRLLFPCD